VPPSRAELAAKHARVVELAAQGVPTSTIAAELHMDRRSVREIRNAAGHPANPKPGTTTRTVEDKWVSCARPVDGGHVEWIGQIAKRSGTPLLMFREQSYSPAAIAFRMRTGREPEGQCFAECGFPHCVSPEHVDDTTTRVRDREALRRVIGMRPAPEVCRKGHDQKAEGRRLPDGRSYCLACQREYKRPLKHRTRTAVAAGLSIHIRES
jgi:hypothetical protein